MSTMEQQNWERDCVAYLRHLSNSCADCLRRYNCVNCAITTAKALLKRKEGIGMRHRQVIDKPGDAHSLKARYREILNVLRAANRPLRTREIVLRTTRSRNAKWWTLRRMVQKGVIRQTRVLNLYGRSECAYVYTRKEKQNENNITPDGECQADSGNPA